ncbi:hypothetical protein REB14_04855 [Chryseobacterium sp. ES2]|uniref:YcxB family protein n=1 Tax=Chryseobacterium metallicongregator TaxID=3073042 RepID=A0ABU1E142_9FLAO|nr:MULTISPECIES: hypothetical protein [Chryseobacterium]MDR4951513.1 hypothetical protein [Chryseobacterium sp. ES2]
MEEPIKLQLYFNENIEWENQRFFFQYTWKKHFVELKKAILYAVLFLALGFLPLKSLNLGPVSVIFKYGSFLFVGYIFLLLYQYFSTKNKTFNLIEEQIENLRRKHEEISFITLHKDSITVKNPFNTINCVWDKTHYKMVDQYLILNMVNNKVNFIFTEPEFKENEYKILLDFLQQHSTKEK